MMKAQLFEVQQSTVTRTQLSARLHYADGIVCRQKIKSAEGIVQRPLAGNV